MPWTVVYLGDCVSYLGSTGLTHLFILFMYIVKKSFTMGAHADHKQEVWVLYNLQQ